MQARRTAGRAAALTIAAALALGAPAARAGTAEMGSYGGAGDTGVRRIPDFEAWLGRPIPLGLEFLFFKNWGNGSVGNSPVSLGGWAIDQWAKQKRKMVFSLPMTVQGTPLSEVAAGTHDDSYRYLAKKLVAKGFGDAILRVGWEFNGGWYPWAAAGHAQDWVAAYRHIVDVMRSVPGQHFRFDWNPAHSQLGIKPDAVYPGDDYVDIIGQDVYCNWWKDADKDPKTRWNTMMNQPYGLLWHKNFAGKHGKPMSFPEWATGTRPDGHGCGDDPYFIEQMAAWISSNNVAYQVYWNYPAPDYNGQLSKGRYPESAAAFLRLFGKGG